MKGSDGEWQIKLRFLAHRSPPAVPVHGPGFGDLCSTGPRDQSLLCVPLSLKAQ